VFAPVAAVISLGAARGQHWRRAIEMVFGVSVGLAIANLFVLTFGTGTWQLAAIAAVAMLAARVFAGGSTLVTQAGVSAILAVAVEAPDPGFVPARFYDTVVGGVIALAASQLLFPMNPMAEVARAARPVFVKLTGSLEETARALAAGDPSRAEGALAQARGIDAGVRAFNDALAIAQETARLAPPRRRAIGHLELYAQAASQVDLAVRNTRVLARAAVSLVRDNEPGPPELSRALFDLAAAVRALSDNLDHRRPDLEARTRACALEAAAHATGVLDDRGQLLTTMVVGQIRLTATDLLRGSGLDLAAAQRALEEAADRVDSSNPANPEGRASP